MARLRRVSFDFEALRILEKFAESRDLDEAYLEEMRGKVQVKELTELFNLNFEEKNTHEHRSE